MDNKKLLGLLRRARNIDTALELLYMQQRELDNHVREAQDRQQEINREVAGMFRLELDGADRGRRPIRDNFPKMFSFEDEGRTWSATIDRYYGGVKVEIRELKELD